MKVHSKSNNFIAILIALLLFAAGFIMYFIHQQSQSDNADKNTPVGLQTSLDSQHVSFSG